MRRSIAIMLAALVVAGCGGKSQSDKDAQQRKALCNYAHAAETVALRQWDAAALRAALRLDKEVC